MTNVFLRFIVRLSIAKGVIKVDRYKLIDTEKMELVGLYDSEEEAESFGKKTLDSYIVCHEEDSRFLFLNRIFS